MRAWGLESRNNLPQTALVPTWGMESREILPQTVLEPTWGLESREILPQTVHGLKSRGEMACHCPYVDRDYRCRGKQGLFCP